MKLGILIELGALNNPLMDHNSIKHLLDLVRQMSPISTMTFG